MKSNIEPLKFNSRKVVEVQEWDRFVTDMYGRPYEFQQQAGCRSRGVFDFEVPLKYEPEDFNNTTVPENCESDQRGVSFKAWLERDPNQKLNSECEWERERGLPIWWARNFYPDISMIIQDLHSKGFLEDGDYTINIDW